ncbi:hypothetical protein N431DRAFT_452721 [Stipitochalara longipes BDJ]|nr:hypothetical protein N431DRAFT_452721 [Stipitochalara longipes BDJ]
MAFRDSHPSDKKRILGYLHNFAIDTVALDSGLVGLDGLIKQFPQTVRKIQYLEVKAPHSNKERRLLSSHQMKEQIVTNLKQMPSLKMITMIWDFGIRKEQFRHQENAAEYFSWHERFLISTLEFLRHSVHAAIGPTTPYKGPQLACLFPPTETWIEERVFRTTHDSQHASFRTLVGNSKVYQDPQIEWLEKNSPWTNDFYGTLIFYRLAKSRSKINADLPVEPQLKKLLKTGRVTQRDVGRYLEVDEKVVARYDEDRVKGLRALRYDRLREIERQEAERAEIRRPWYRNLFANSS